MTVIDRIFQLRTQMMALGIDAYIVPSTDPHMSEYPSAHWQQREWISGFSGSAGTVVVMAEEAGLWTDSRYYLQAEKELEDSGIELFKAGEPGVVDHLEYIAERLDPSSTVAFNGHVFSVDSVRKMGKKFKPYRIQMDTQKSLVEDMWQGREPLPEDTIYDHEIEFAGLSRKEKIKAIRNEMHKVDASHYIITGLDEIAWALNLRGNDVPFNPVFHAYMTISLDDVSLFIDTHKIPSSLGKILSKEGIRIHLYNDITRWLNRLPSDSGILVDPNKTNAAIFSAIPKEVVRIEKTSPVISLKSIKNDTEIAGIKKAMVKDGIALTKFFHWLEQNIETSTISEIQAARQLKKFRKEQEHFVGESFATIAGFGVNGAIVHYRPDKVENTKITKDNFLLMDSGGQYRDGTTDITRTIHLGTPSPQQISDYTRVLKGHIALATTCFPKGTKGAQLDILARKSLWSAGLNYGHGTGHGVGCFLNVHEGPQSIRPQDNGVSIKPGMITSNEPGLYRQGEYGIRIENLLLTKKGIQTEFGEFYEFSTLTLFPIETKTIDTDLLSPEEKKWLNSYHKKVFDTLSPLLDEELQNWLKNKTKELS